jgi:hypothetical protein
MHVLLVLEGVPLPSLVQLVVCPAVPWASINSGSESILLLKPALEVESDAFWQGV